MSFKKINKGITVSVPKYGKKYQKKAFFMKIRRFDI
jgi:hypothetical protein